MNNPVPGPEMLNFRGSPIGAALEKRCTVHEQHTDCVLLRGAKDRTAIPQGGRSAQIEHSQSRRAD